MDGNDMDLLGSSLLNAAETRGGLGPCVGDDSVSDDTVEHISSCRLATLFDEAEAKGSLGRRIGDLGPCVGDDQSDVRLKTDIVRIGTTALGLPLYRFSYKNRAGTYTGVMAQDVLEVLPEAVQTGPDGFYRVDYRRLGISMDRVA